MTIKTGNTIRVIKCDICSETIEGMIWAKLCERAATLGWTTRRRNGKWEDLCPECSAKYNRG